MRPLHIILLIIAASLSIAKAHSAIYRLQAEGRRLIYHHLPALGVQKGVVIFLHGSVKAYRDLPQGTEVSVSDLMEGNPGLAEAFNAQGYELVIPICSGEYNWLELKGNDYIDSLEARYRKDGQPLYLAGFSDGGTGAYRYFYTHPERYAGVLILNGYPQLQNFYRKVRYEQAVGKPVIFCAQDNDKVVPKEFLLTEYRRQKLLNNTTYFMVKPGGHELRKYTAGDVAEWTGLWQLPAGTVAIEADSVTLYPPLDAYVVDTKVLALYRFRAKTGSSYGMIKRECQAGREPGFDPEKATVRVYPARIPKAELRSRPQIDFPVEIDGKRTILRLENYLSFNAW